VIHQPSHKESKETDSIETTEDHEGCKVGAVPPTTTTRIIGGSPRLEKPYKIIQSNHQMLLWPRDNSVAKYKLINFSAQVHDITSKKFM